MTRLFSYIKTFPADDANLERDLADGGAGAGREDDVSRLEFFKPRLGDDNRIGCGLEVVHNEGAGFGASSH